MNTDPLELLCSEAVGARVAPGGIVCAGTADGEVVCLPFGTTDYVARVRVNADTIYDVASLTKPIATAASAMVLVGKGELNVDRLARDYVPGLPDGISVAHLLGHAAGFPAHVKFYEHLELGDRNGLFAAAAKVPLVRAPGTAAEYSDVGYILLGQLLETVGAARLDRLMGELVTTPLGMTATRYVDSAVGASPLDRPGTAPTEVYPDRGVARGQVHDENAFAAGGICGHAGVFSRGPDVGRLCRALLRAARGAEVAGLSPAVVEEFTTRSMAPRAGWRLGFDSPSETLGVSHAGDRWSRTHGVGHLGFTGCSMWLDLEASFYAVVLTNRVHPSRENSGIKELRRGLMDALVDGFRKVG